MPPTPADPSDVITLQVRRRANAGSTVVDMLLDTPRAPEPVRADTTITPAKAECPAPVEVPCPRCGARLINPKELALCPGCGWCRSLEEAACLSAAPDRGAPRGSLLGSREFCHLLRKVPAWTWLLFGGIAAACTVAGAADQLLPVQGVVRAAWTAGQIGFGLILVVAAQAWVLVLLAPADDRLGAKDVFLSGRLWTLACKHLATTKGPVSLAAWGMTLALGAGVWIGGLSYWLPVGK